MLGRATELPEGKFVFSTMIMVFFIKGNILYHSPYPGQVMRFDFLSGVWRLLWETIHFTDAFDQEGTLRVGEEEHKN